MAFRPALTKLRRQWEQVIGGLKNPADGFFLINELRSPRKQQRYPQALIDAYQAASAAIAKNHPDAQMFAIGFSRDIFLSKARGG
jgi:hypothetical protein